MVETKSNHALHPMVVLDPPRRIKVVPCEVRIAASIHWTVETHFLP